MAALKAKVRECLFLDIGKQTPRERRYSLSRHAAPEPEVTLRKQRDNTLQVERCALGGPFERDEIDVGVLQQWEIWGIKHVNSALLRSRGPSRTRDPLRKQLANLRKMPVGNRTINTYTLWPVW
jgi:hypothetical protein